MRKLVILASLLVLTACTVQDPYKKSEIDQCLRREIFNECLINLPKSPEKAIYNDWDEVVSVCYDFALYASKRPAGLIKQECRYNLY